MNDPDEVDLADDDLRDEREAHEAHKADQLLDEMKMDGSYARWRKSGLSYEEFVRDEVEREYEAARRRHGGS
jgi:hypothetical protein